MVYSKKTFLEVTAPMALKALFNPEKLESLALLKKSEGKSRVIVTAVEWVEDEQRMIGYVEYFPETKETETVVEPCEKDFIKTL